MGFRVLLIVVTGKEPALVQREYGVAPTGKFEEIPDPPVCGVSLTGGRYLMFINDKIEPDPRVFRKLSRNAVLLACYVNETDMNSYAASWIDGMEQWSVFHDPDEGIEHIETTGDPPKQLSAIRKKQLTKQEGDDEVDYIFDIPVELFAALGGMRYDQDPPGAGPVPWEVLERR